MAKRRVGNVSCVGRMATLPASVPIRKRGKRTRPPPRTPCPGPQLPPDAASVEVRGIHKLCALVPKRVPSWQSAPNWKSILGRPDLAYFREFGVPVSAFVPVAPARADNYATFKANESLAVARLLEMKKKGRLVGPIPPALASFLGVVVSPLGCVPKDGGSDFRIVHDLSLFVNPFCEDPKLSFPSLEEVKRSITPGCWFWKGDLLDGYKQFFLEPKAWHWFGLQFQGEIYLDATLAFGWNAAPGFFSAFSYAIRDWQRGLGDCVFTYVDDFFGVHPSQSLASAGLSRWVDVLGELGLADKLSKRHLPAQVCPFLGLEWDSIAMQVRLPEAKKVALLGLLHSFVGRRWASVRDVQRLAGKLGFAAQVLRGGWVHLRRVWDSYKGCADRAAHKLVRIGKGFHSDVAFWMEFLPKWNGISTLEPSVDVRVGTDACKLGFGARCGGKWMAGAWSLSARASRHSNWKELVTVLLAARHWGHLWRNCVVVVDTDNKATAGIINRGYSPCREYMRIARKLFWIAVDGGFEVKANWIPGTSNSIPDALSRWLTIPNSFQSGGGGLPPGLVLPGSAERLDAQDLRDRVQGVHPVPPEV